MALAIAAVIGFLAGLAIGVVATHVMLSDDMSHPATRRGGR